MVTQTMNKGSRGMTKTRAYGKMLVVAFGLAVIAVMVVHKLRERRILNLIVEDKDQQLISIHLLLQREMDMNKEMSRKIEDLRPRLHILRSQKMELNGRVIELQSTISSLKDDIKVVESNLHIKNVETNMLRDKITEILKEKDAEIEQLKQANAEKLQHQGIQVQSALDQFMNSTTVTDQKVVEADVKRADESKGLETGSVTRNVEDEDGQGQVGDATKGGMKLEVPSESKHGAEITRDVKRSAMSRAKGKKWKDIARTRRLRNNALTMRTKKVSNKDNEKHEHGDEIHDTSLDVGKNVVENKTIVAEGSRLGLNITFETELATGDGRVGARDNKPIENPTMEKVDEVESRIKEGHGEDKGYMESVDDVSEKIEFKDVPDEFISSMESMNNRILDSKNDEDDGNHGDLKGIKEDELQDSEANESGNGSSDQSDSEEQDQHDQNSHSENGDDDDDDPHETDAEEDHTNDDTEDEEENSNRSHTLL